MSSVQLVVLCPNGRRETVKTTANHSILQILEDVCNKHNLKSEDYALRHLNRMLDLSNTVRFSNLPNKALLELVPETKIRTESLVNLILQLESGERLLNGFPPSATLWDIIIYWEKEKSTVLLPTQEDLEPVCVFMRNEIIGQEKLKGTSLRKLGLISGNAIIRLIVRPIQENRNQAHVDVPLPKVTPSRENESVSSRSRTSNLPPSSSTGFESASNSQVPLRKTPPVERRHANGDSKKVPFNNSTSQLPVEEMDVDESPPASPARRSLPPQPSSSSPYSTNPMDVIAKDKIIMLGERKAIVYSLDDIQIPMEELPDSFFDVTLDDVKYLFADLKRKKEELESSNLQTRAMRLAGLRKKDKYVHSVIRVQFPDRLVLQGQFKSKEKVVDIMDFVRTYLTDVTKPFHLYTTPPKQILKPSDDLNKASLVPKAVVHFGCELDQENCLRLDLRSKLSSPAGASCLSSHRRQVYSIKPSGSSSEEAEDSTVENVAPRPPISTSPGRSRKSSGDPSSKHTPKWFSLGKKKNEK